MLFEALVRMQDLLALFALIPRLLPSASGCPAPMKLPEGTYHLFFFLYVAFSTLAYGLLL
jgi:hypothetical protein